MPGQRGVYLTFEDGLAGLIVILHANAAIRR